MLQRTDLPNLTIPGDAIEAQAIALHAAEYPGSHWMDESGDLRLAYRAAARSALAAPGQTPAR